MAKGNPPPSPGVRGIPIGQLLSQLGGRNRSFGWFVDQKPFSAVLTDFAHYQEWVPFVRASDARRQPDGAVVSAQSLHLPALVGDRSYQIRAVSTATGGVSTTRWTYVPGSGNVVDTHGSWTVVSFGPGRSLATCRLFTDPGRVPHWAMNRATEESLPWIFKGLRQQVMRDRYLHD